MLKKYFDIICFDINEKLPFNLKGKMLKEAINRGITFEISYSSAI